jgi:predicted TIM-barrel fold metal-dependent hydrolase
VQNVISVDSHFHVFKAGQALPGARYRPAYDAPLAAWRAAALPQQVTHGVLVQPSFLGTDNSFLLAQLAHPSLPPDTLRGVAVVAPSADADLLASLHAQGVRGIRLNLAGPSHGMHPAMEVWARATLLWDAVLQLGWHVELHTDSGALPHVLAALPQALPVVVAHFGKPAAALPGDATVTALRRRNKAVSASSAAPQPLLPPVHIKLSGAYRLDAGLSARALTRLWRDELGPQALLWGSDWPCTSHESQADYPALCEALDDWLGSDGDAVTATRCANPLRLYWGR